MAQGFLPLGIVVSLIAIVWIVAIVARRRYLIRMGTRHFRRRPTETLLIIVGSILGTALITGSFITNDSLRAAFTNRVYEGFGEVDEQILLSSPEAVERAGAALPEIRALDSVDGAAILETATGSTRAQADQTKTEPRTEVYALDVAQLDEFGSDPQTVSGPNLGADEAIVTRSLADELGIDVGDQFDLFIYGQTVPLSVVRVADGEGFATFRDGKDVFVSAGLLTALAGNSSMPSLPQQELWVSNVGGVKAGVDHSGQVATSVEEILGSEDVEVLEAKQIALDAAERAADSISQLFLVVGTFGVVAGILLLVNIFVMLAAERQPELGIMRAIGMKRADLVRGFVGEGSIYAGCAAALGAVAGIGVGVAIVRIADRIFAIEAFDLDVSVNLALKGSSVLAGLLAGFAISFVTIVFTSLRISRVNIVAAIRELEPPKQFKRGVATMTLGSLGIVAGLAMTGAGLAAQDPILALLGPAIAGLSAVPLAGRGSVQRLVVSIIAAIVLTWGLVLPLLMPDLLSRSDSVFVFVVHGLVTTFAAVGLLAVNQEFLASGAKLVARQNPSHGLAARLATSYPAAKRFRTAMTLIMYVLIVFTLVVITTIGHVNQLNTEAITRRESNGFDIIATTTTATAETQSALEASPGVEEVLGIPASPAILKDAEGLETDTTYGVDARFVADTSYPLREFASEFDSSQATWEAVSKDPSLVIVDQRFTGGQEGPGSTVILSVGDRVEMTDPVSGQTVERRVAAINEAGIALPGVFISSDALMEQFLSARPTDWLIKASPGEPLADIVQELEANNVATGLEAMTFTDLVNQIMVFNLQFFGLMRGYLALGLVVGIVGLGVVMIRAVRERRRTIGVLRALGFRAATVRRAFMGEAGIVAAEGIILGILLGLVTSRNILTSSIGESFDVPFAIPWSEISILAALAFGFSVLVALFPARAAAKVRPAVALRTAE